jgi:hypothetical protein
METVQSVLEVVTGFFDSFPAWITALTSLFVAAKAVTVLTPTRADNRFVDTVLRVLNALALNVGKDRNADDVGRDNQSSR